MTQPDKRPCRDAKGSSGSEPFAKKDMNGALAQDRAQRRVLPRCSPGFLGALRLCEKTEFGPLLAFFILFMVHAVGSWRPLRLGERLLLGSCFAVLPFLMVRTVGSRRPLRLRTRWVSAVLRGLHALHGPRCLLLALFACLARERGLSYFPTQNRAKTASRIDSATSIPWSSPAVAYAARSSSAIMSGVPSAARTRPASSSLSPRRRRRSRSH